MRKSIVPTTMRIAVRTTTVTTIAMTVAGGRLIDVSPPINIAGVVVVEVIAVAVLAAIEVFEAMEVVKVFDANFCVVHNSWIPCPLTKRFNTEVEGNDEPAQAACASLCID